MQHAVTLLMMLTVNYNAVQFLVFILFLLLPMSSVKQLDYCINHLNSGVGVLFDSCVVYDLTRLSAHILVCYQQAWFSWT